MRVVVSCGQKFHSDYMSEQLHARGALSKTLTAHPPFKYLNRVDLPRAAVDFLPPVFLPAVAVGRYFGGGMSRVLDNAGIALYDRMAARHIPREVDAFIGWSRSSLRQIQAVQERGGTAFVEQCGSYSQFQNDILREERSRLGLPPRPGTPQLLVDREAEEFEQADYVLCPSRHVAGSLVAHGFAREKLLVNPYGANLQRFHPVGRRDGAFRVLFVGSIGARKGVVYLLEAMERLRGEAEIECVLIGRVEEGFDRVLKPYEGLFRHIERVPNSELKYEYSNASVFVFPSLDEGMALVQLEAMACGLPVICTPNSGGDSLIEEGESGFVVPVRDPDALATQIYKLYENRELLAQLREGALARIGQFSWDRYGERLFDILQFGTGASLR